MGGLWTPATSTTVTSMFLIFDLCTQFSLKVWTTIVLPCKAHSDVVPK